MSHLPHRMLHLCVDSSSTPQLPLSINIPSIQQPLVAVDPSSTPQPSPSINLPSIQQSLVAVDSFSTPQAPVSINLSSTQQPPVVVDSFSTTQRPPSIKLPAPPVEVSVCLLFAIVILSSIRLPFLKNVVSVICHPNPCTKEVC